MVLELGNGPVKFRCTQIKEYHREHDYTTPLALKFDQLAPIRRDPPLKKKRGRPRKDAIHPPSPPIPKPDPPRRKRGRLRKNAVRPPPPQEATASLEDGPTPAREEESSARQSSQRRTMRPRHHAFLTQKETND
jgi:hypothetical protein